MALTVKIILVLLALNLGGNEIGNVGCEFLSQSKWNRLNYLQLYRNNISSEGVRQLCKSHWPYLKYLLLGTFWMFRIQSNREQRLPLIMQRKMG